MDVLKKVEDNINEAKEYKTKQAEIKRKQEIKENNAKQEKENANADNILKDMNF
jgi:hypothetical protein